MKLFGVIFELSGVLLYLYRDYVTVLAKIGATTVTLMDKIKMEFIH